MTSCGPDEHDRCDYSFICPKYQEEVERERVAQQDRDERTEMLHLLREMSASLNTIATYLEPVIKEQQQKRMVDLLKATWRF